MFNAIGQPRFNSPLIRFFGMKIGGAAAPTLAPEIAPSFDVNQQDDPALFFLRGERLLSGYRSPAAVAAQYTRVRLRNPVGSGVLCIVDAIQAISGASVVYGSENSLVDETTPSKLNSLDGRWSISGGTLPTCIFSDGANAATGSPNVFGVIGANELAIRPVRAVLPPGSGFLAFVSVVNTSMTFTIWARERLISAEELATG